MRLSAGVFLSLLSLTPGAYGQVRSVAPPPTQEGTGAVTGHVICRDTNSPARFARVSLQPVTVTPPATPRDKAARKALNLSPAPGPGRRSAMTSVETSPDGSFTLTKVAPGSYRVIVEKEGYINQRAMFTEKDLDSASPEMQAIVDRALPRVQVGVNQSATADILLERGAAVSGVILYDDGSPAGEVPVKLLHKDESGKWVPVTGYSVKFGNGISTNDRGAFRMASLLPDEYLLQAELSLNDSKSSTSGDGDHQMEFVMQTSRFSLPFYGRGTPREDEAAGFKLRAGEELGGQDMTIPISRLHRLTGRVAAGADAHDVNAASLALVLRDGGKTLATSSVSREDGLFHFEFVPAGDYILRVTNARDVVWEQPEKARDAPPSPFPLQDVERVLRTYGEAEQPMLLDGDRLGVTVTVPPGNKAASANTMP